MIKRVISASIMIFWLASGIMIAQTLDWIYTSEKNSYGSHVYQARSGAYLLGTGYGWSSPTEHAFSTVTEEISVDGELISSSVHFKGGHGFRDFIQLDQSTLGLLTGSGVVIAIDESGHTIDTLFQIPRWFSPRGAVLSGSILSMVGTNRLSMSLPARMVVDLSSNTILKEENEEIFESIVYHNLVALPDGSTIAALSGIDNFTVVKRNNTDDVEWVFTEEFPEFSPSSMTVVGDVFYLVGTFKDTVPIDPCGVVMKFTTSGEKLWEYRYYAAETEAVDVIHFTKIIEAPDESLSIAGVEGYMISDSTTYGWNSIITDALIININSDGEVNWEKRINTGSKGAMANDVLYDENGDLMVAGTTGLLTGYSGGSERAFVAKILIPSEVLNDDDLPAFKVSPNPCSDVLNVDPLVTGKRFVLTDSYGKQVDSGIVNGPIDMRNLPSGLFVLYVEGYLPIKVIKVN
jgi:hypothetical protein